MLFCILFYIIRSFVCFISVCCYFTFTTFLHTFYYLFTRFSLPSFAPPVHLLPPDLVRLHPSLPHALTHVTTLTRLVSYPVLPYLTPVAVPPRSPSYTLRSGCVLLPYFELTTAQLPAQFYLPTARSSAAPQFTQLLITPRSAVALLRSSQVLSYPVLPRVTFTCLPQFTYPPQFPPAQRCAFTQRPVTQRYVLPSCPVLPACLALCVYLAAVCPRLLPSCARARCCTPAPYHYPLPYPFGLPPTLTPQFSSTPDRTRSCPLFVLPQVLPAPAFWFTFTYRSSTVLHAAYRTTQFRVLPAARSPLPFYTTGSVPSSAFWFPGSFCHAHCSSPPQFYSSFFYLTAPRYLLVLPCSTRSTADAAACLTPTTQLLQFLRSAPLHHVCVRAALRAYPLTQLLPPRRVPVFATAAPPRYPACLPAPRVHPALPITRAALRLFYFTLRLVRVWFTPFIARILPFCRYLLLVTLPRCYVGFTVVGWFYRPLLLQFLHSLRYIFTTAFVCFTLLRLRFRFLPQLPGSHSCCFVGYVWFTPCFTLLLLRLLHGLPCSFVARWLLPVYLLHLPCLLVVTLRCCSLHTLRCFGCVTRLHTRTPLRCYPG